MANGNGSNGSNGQGGLGVKVGQALEKTDEKVRGSQAWTAIFRPGSVFRRGYSRTGRLLQLVVYGQKVIFSPYWSWRKPFSRDCVAKPKLWLGVTVVLTMLAAQKVCGTIPVALAK